MIFNLDRKVILASGSPRRRELLTMLGVDFEVIVSDVNEDKIKIANPGKLVGKLAELKCEEVSKRDDIVSENIIIGADTVVSYKSSMFAKPEILGKPKDELDAMRMLKMLNGKKHQVYTGMCIIDMKTMTKKVFVSKVDVYFDNVPDEVIMNYIKSGEAVDKAGSYAIQNAGSMFVKKIKGDYYSVVGLSNNKLCQELYKISKQKN